MSANSFKPTESKSPAEIARPAVPALNQNHPVESAVRNTVERRESNAINTAGGWSPGGYVDPAAFKQQQPKG